MPADRLHPELRDKKQFWNRKVSCLKAHMLLLGHLSRDEVPPALKKDALYVLRKSPQVSCCPSLTADKLLC